MSHRQIDALLAESGDGLDPAARADLREGLGGLLVLVEDTAPAPSPELAALLDPASPKRAAMVSDLEQVRARLGSPGAAARVADIATQIVR